MRGTFEADEDGHRLLRCIRAYVELDLLASFEVHTEDTIKRGRAVANRFAKLANVSHLFFTRNATAVDVLEHSGIPKGGLELPQNAPDSTPFRRYRGQGCHPKLQHETL